MKIVVGLGNPGREYAKTPHNVGFDVVDELAGRCGVSLKRALRFKARYARTTIRGEPAMLVEPQTFMNLSGTAVGPIMRYHNCVPADVVVVVDDADLEFGRLRIRPSGSSGGHRGLESLVEGLGSSDFPRVRVGIGRPADGAGLVEHVLSSFSAGELKEVAGLVAAAADAVEAVIGNGVAAAMNSFNARNRKQEEESQRGRKEKGIENV